MPRQEVLIMAMTRMRSGICTASFLTESDPITHHRWVRPVKDFGTLLLGDMTDGKGRIVQVGDVVELNLLQPRPISPHCEDWSTDFIKQRPRLLRQLAEQKRADFLASHADCAPADVLINQSRSLCLVHPTTLWANFALDQYTGEYKAKIGFCLPDLDSTITNPPSGLAVTDLKWRALGRLWLAEEGCQHLRLDQRTLLSRLCADDIHLCIGLGRSFQGAHWPLVIGVHAVPDYQIEIDYTTA